MMAATTDRACQVCLCAALEPCLTVEDGGFAPPRKTDVYACAACGSGKTWITATPATVRAGNDELYNAATDYARRVHSDEYLRRCLDDAIWIMQRQGSRRRGTAMRHLDIGCSSGGMLSAFQHLGYDSYGIEPSIAADRAPADLAGRIQKCYFGEETVSKPFDLITAFHVLEHVVDPAAFLGRCRHCLKPGGVLVIEVPDFDVARTRLRDKPTALLNHISPYYHVHHFTLNGLDALLRRSGFKMLRGDRVAPYLGQSVSDNAQAVSQGSRPDAASPERPPRAPALAVRLLRAAKNAAWSSRSVRIWSRHVLAHGLGLGQHVRVIAQVAEPAAISPVVWPARPVSTPRAPE
jgi:SAM-dependent methyltransferase